MNIENKTFQKIWKGGSTVDHLKFIFSSSRCTLLSSNCIYIYIMTTGKSIGQMKEHGLWFANMENEQLSTISMSQSLLSLTMTTRMDSPSIQALCCYNCLSSNKALRRPLVTLHYCFNSIMH